MRRVVVSFLLAASFLSTAASVASSQSATPAVRDSLAPAAAAVDSVPPPRRPSLLQRAGTGTRAVLSDCGYVAMAPFRMNRSTVMWTVGALAVGAALYASDQEVYDGFQRSRGNAAYDAVIDAGEWIEPIGFMGNTNVYYAGALAIGVALDWRPLQVIPAQVLESHMIAGGIRNVAKAVAGRTHPYENLGARNFSWNGGSSFTSGHTSVLFEDATIISHHVGQLPVTVVCYGLATAMALQRIDSGNHWPSDVYFGALTGLLVSQTVIRRNAEREQRVRFGLIYESGGAAFAVHWRL